MQKRATIVLLILLLAVMFSLASAANVESTYVAPEGQSSISGNFHSGEKVSGSFNVTGGTNKNWGIDFWVRDPTGTIVLNSGRVVHGENFTFTADHDGEYTFNFGNSFASVGKRVWLMYDVSPPPIIGLDPTIFLAAVLVAATVLASLAFIFYRRSHIRKKAKENLPPPPPQ